MVSLGILNAQMVAHVIIQQPHLLKQFEQGLSEIIARLDDVEGFIKLLIVILSLDPLHLKHIKSHFPHFYGVQFGRPRVSSFAHEPIFIPRIVLLVLHYVLLVLVKLRVQVEEVNACNVNLIHILRYWVSGTDADVSDALEPGVFLVQDTRCEASTIIRRVVYLKGTINHSVFYLQITSLKVVHEAGIVSVS